MIAELSSMPTFHRLQPSSKDEKKDEQERKRTAVSTMFAFSVVRGAATNAWLGAKAEADAARIKTIIEDNIFPLTQLLLESLAKAPARGPSSSSSDSIELLERPRAWSGGDGRDKAGTVPSYWPYHNQYHTFYSRANAHCPCLMIRVCMLYVYTSRRRPGTVQVKSS